MIKGFDGNKSTALKHSTIINDLASFIIVGETRSATFQI